MAKSVALFLSGPNLFVTDGTASGTSELTVDGVSSAGWLAVEPPDLTALGSLALLEGEDASNHFNLWVTDGTKSGTTEFMIAGPNRSGLGSSPDFTVFGSRALFAGTDKNGKTNPWVTDGTATGTSELTAPTNAGINGLEPRNFAVFGDKALFVGIDTAGASNLWVTDGTSGGTSELTVNGADPLGLFSGELLPYFTAFGGDALFRAADKAGKINLWVTDGKSTSELNVAAYSLGLLSLANPDFTVFGSKVLFDGMDAGGHLGLWVTDGTTPGTDELVKINGAYPQGLFAHSLNPELTVLGSKLLFAGLDLSDHPNLWVTDGTSAGTSELNVGNSFPNGLLDVVNPDFTVLGTKMLFSGVDAAGHIGLWVTDGTVPGTSELTTAGGALAGVSDLTVFGSEALFNGGTVSAGSELWVTDGTLAGTSEVTTGVINPANITVLVAPAPAPFGLALASGSDSGVKGDRHHQCDEADDHRQGRGRGHGDLVRRRRRRSARRWWRQAAPGR